MSAARDLANLGNTNALKVDTTTQRVGIKSTSPDVTLDIGGDVTSSGVVTATSFVGDGSSLTGINSVSLATTAYGLSSQAHTLAGGVITISDTTASTNTTSGALVVSGGVGIAKSLNVGGNLSVGGTLTYEDVTNIDSVGIVTAGGGLYVGNASISGIGITASNAGHIIAAGIITTGTCIKVGSVSGGSFGAGVGVTITGDGNAIFSGISTVTNFDAKGTLVEAFSSVTTAWSSSGNLNLSNGNLHFNSANLGGTGTALNVISNAGINTDIAVGQAFNVTAITAVNASTAFVNALKIDGKGTGITTSWVGGSTPSDGGSSAYDTYSFNVLKTGSETYIVIANQSKTS